MPRTDGRRAVCCPVRELEAASTKRQLVDDSRTARLCVESILDRSVYRPDQKPGRTLDRLVEELASSGMSVRVLQPPSAGGGQLVQLEGVSYDSRTLRPGELFVAVEGFRTDGHRYVVEAARGGAAAAVVSQRKLAEVERALSSAGALLPLVVCDDTRSVMAYTACWFYGHPSRSGVDVVGVTGTNGKTSTTYLLTSIFEAAGLRSGLVGTVEVRVGARVIEAVRTTPEAPDLQRLFRQMIDHGVHVCALEVSSHSLALHRVDGTRFRVGVFTNLSHDHLDFHATLEDYFEAKARLFSSSLSERAAVNVSDTWGARLAKRLSMPVVRFGERDDGAEVWAGDVELRREGSSFVLNVGPASERVTLPLAGGFAVWNALAAAAAAHAMEIDIGAVAEGLRRVKQVPGRFQRVDRGQDFLAVVDYAHTPASLRSVLQTARELAARGRGKVIVVVGCGGDRDRAKRPVMAREAVDGADIAVFTTDNPRSEDPREILKEMESGVVYSAKKGSDYMIVVDRCEAIRTAVSMAGSGDVVVIAGKGHERYQEVAGRKLPFDDVEVVAEAIDDIVPSVSSRAGVRRATPGTGSP